MTTKSTSMNIRIEPQLKREAEAIFDELGLSLAGAVNIFLKQSVLKRGLPFEVTLPSKTPTALDEMSREELHALIKEGLADVEAGRTLPAKDAFKQVREKYGL